METMELYEYNKIIEYNRRNCDAVLSKNNEVEIFVDGIGKFNRLNEDLKNAMDTVAKKFGDKVNGVPYIVIGDEASWPGYQSAFDNDIKKAIKKAYENENYKDIVAPLINSSIGEKKDEHSNDTIITVAILVVLVGGIGSLVYFSRKKQK